MDKMTPNDYPQVKFRTGTGSELELALDERVERQSDYSRIAKRDLNRYYLLLPYLLPRFSEQEAVLLVNALNGTRLETERADKIWSEVEDEQLSAKLKAFSFPECMAVLDAVERFWKGPYCKDDTLERLKSVGLVKQPQHNL